MKAVVLALAATAFIFLVYLKVDQQIKANPAASRQAYSRRFGFKSHHLVFDPLVASMERQGVKIGGNDNASNPFKMNGLASEVKEAYDYFNDEGKLNITLRIVVLFPWLDTSPKDGFVNFKELEAWNMRMATERLNYRTQREIEARDEDGDGTIGFREYLHHMTDNEIENNGTRHGEAGWWREQFENADLDHNGTLHFEEFRDFLHPEDSENEKIQKWLLGEKIKRMDYDEDGRLSYSEFLERAYDTYRNYIDFESAGAYIPSPETIFSQLDVNKDGFLCVEELMPILRYLHPGELAYAKYFTSYLFHEADENRDGKLSLEEMLDHEYIFYSSVYEENHEDYDEEEDFHDEL
uniref:EF-hand domain-containing protein n=1 Tax=Kalanchoe fedtschenkoi TaxID=63787 RepID=A0A7N0TF75_KALFE